MQSAGLRLNALSLELAAIASVLGAFAVRRIRAADAAAMSALAVAAATVLLARLRRQRLPLADPLVAGAGIADGAGGILLSAGLELLGPVPVATPSSAAWPACSFSSGRSAAPASR